MPSHEIFGTTLDRDIDLVCQLIWANKCTDRRTIIGIAGPPASGKSTLAEAVVQKLNHDERIEPIAALLPMDGYHLDNSDLEKRGLLERKGAPQTFDSIGFCQAVLDLQNPETESFHPLFNRQMDKAIPNSITIEPTHSIVVVEGNYLLLKSAPWSGLSSVFAATFFITPTLEVLRERLFLRWISHGLDPETAKLRTINNDLPNAQIVLNESRKPDLKLDQDY